MLFKKWRKTVKNGDSEIDFKTEKQIRNKEEILKRVDVLTIRFYDVVNRLEVDDARFRRQQH